MPYEYTCSKSIIVSLKEWKSERSPRFAALFSSRGGPFRLLLPSPCPPASTSTGEDLPGGLLEGSCGRRKRRSAKPAKRWHVCSLNTAVSKYENSLRSLASKGFPDGYSTGGYVCVRFRQKLRTYEVVFANDA